MNAENILTRVRALSGQRIVLIPNIERPTFLFNNTECLTIGNLRHEDGYMQFDMLIPTHVNDCHDYIWRSELEAGTTDKVILVQDGIPLSDARVSSILREGGGYAHQASGPEQYRLGFHVPLHAFTNGVLQVRICWHTRVFATVG
jgi:hypothetical protein